MFLHNILSKSRNPFGLLFRFMKLQSFALQNPSTFMMIPGEYSGIPYNKATTKENVTFSQIITPIREPLFGFSLICPKKKPNNLEESRCLH